MKKVFLSLSTLCLSLLNLCAQTNNQERDFHISFISPFGINGTQSHLVTNKFSINLLGGYSYGNTAFEFGGLYNVNTHTTKGFQLAGLANYSGYSDRVTQFSGITNVINEGTTIIQFGGISNIADKVQGLQLGGIINIANQINGTQMAGILNVTSELNGVQFGLINIANNSEKGTPIGLINIVKKGGKQEFEIGFSETLNTTASFKLGTDRFYTIFSAGINYLEQPINYAAGLGFGTHLDWKKGWGNQIEALGYALTEDGKFVSDLNMLTQLKFTVSKEFAKHLKVYAGPVLNMTISNYSNPETGKLGSSLSPWSMWQNNSDKTRVNAWIGLSTGVRF